VRDLAILFLHLLATVSAPAIAARIAAKTALGSVPGIGGFLVAMLDEIVPDSRRKKGATAIVSDSNRRSLAAPRDARHASFWVTVSSGRDKSFARWRPRVVIEC